MDINNEKVDNTIVPVRRGRKSKKQTQKELLNMYYDEIGIPLKPDTINSNNVDGNRDNRENRVYNQYQYLSAAERARLERKFTVPKNVHQDQYYKILQNKNKKIVVVTGPAGTGKTLFATEFGVRHLITGEYEKLVFTRPSVTVDEDIGYLPGTLEDKMAPWVRPIFDILYGFITPKEVQQYVEDKIIEISPLGFMRGRTFKNTWIVADEMQNSSIGQMKMLLTRLGENSRLIITGDLEQFDRIGELNGLDDFLSKFKGKRSSSISSFEFNKEDIQREEVVKEVLDIYSSVDIPTNYIGEDVSNSMNHE